MLPCHYTGDIIPTRKSTPIRWLVLSSCADSAHFVPICLLSQQPCIINMIIRKCMRSVCEADYAYLVERLGTANFEQVLHGEKSFVWLVLYAEK